MASIKITVFAESIEKFEIMLNVLGGVLEESN